MTFLDDTHGNYVSSGGTGLGCNIDLNSNGASGEKSDEDDFLHFIREYY